MQTDAKKKANGFTEGYGSAVAAKTATIKDVDKQITGAIRTLREARATWQNFQASPKEVATIVATQMKMLSSRFAETARILEAGGGR